MTFVPAARKYRPQRFSEVLGQDVIVRIIQNALTQETNPGVYLLSGQRGCGKTTLGRLIAKALNCQAVADQRARGERVDPCGSCDDCLNIANGRSELVFELDAASHNGVDDARELEGLAKQMPPPDKVMVLILDEAHQLTVSAQNALLLLLENPPARFMPIICTTDKQKLLPTIVSRCCSLTVRPLRPDSVTASLARIFADANQPIEPAALALLAQQGQGSLRDVQQLADQVIVAAGGILIDDAFLEQAIGLPSVRMYRKLIGALEDTLSEGFAVWVDFIATWLAEGFSPHDLYFTMLPNLLRDCLLARGVIERGIEPPVPYLSGIEHSLFQEALSLTYRDLDILQESWEKHSKHFGLHGMTDRVVLETFMMVVINVKRFESS